MLAFAPRPFLDETLYSIAARWFALSGFKSQQQFVEAAFQAPIDFDACDLGSSASLATTAAFQLSRQEVVQRHTLQPFFRFFVDCAVMDKFASGQRANLVFGYLSVARRWCPRCAIEHRARNGVAAWLRAHNLPGVGVCHVHECRLHQMTKRKRLLDLVPYDVKENDLVAASAMEVWYAREANCLLENAEAPTRFREFHQSLREAIVRRFPKNRNWDADVLYDALSKSLSDAGTADAQDLSWYNIRARIERDLKPCAVSINPTAAIHIAHISCEGGITAVMRDIPERLHLKDAKLAALKKNKPLKKHKSLTPVQRMRAERQRLRAAADRKRRKAHQQFVGLINRTRSSILNVQDKHQNIELPADSRSTEQVPQELPAIET